MYKEFQTIEELREYVATDKHISGEQAFTANRYPIRFVLFDNFRDSFDFITFIQKQGCYVESVESWLDVSYPDTMVTHTELCKNIKKYISTKSTIDVVIAPFSELARFYDNNKAHEFDALIRTIKGIESSSEGFDTKQRVYIPIVGLEGKMSMFVNDPQINIWYFKNVDKQNNYRLILAKETYGVNEITDSYSIVNNVNEWMKIWKDQSAMPNIISISKSLFANAKYAQPDNAFDFCTCNNVFEFLSNGLGLNFGAIQYKTQDEQHWLRLATEINIKHFSFEDFFNRYFHIDELADYNVFLKTWFECNGNFPKWLLCTYYMDKFCNSGYICRVINELTDYNDVTLFSKIALQIFDISEDEREKYIEERAICLKYAKTKNIHLSNDTQESIVKEIEKIRAAFGVKKAYNYISSLTEAEQVLMLEWLGKDLLHLDTIQDIFPEIYAFFSPMGISLDNQKSWIKEYMRAYTNAKLHNTYTQEIEKCLMNRNADSLKFNAWYQDFKTTKTELLNRKDIEVFYWIDGLGIEWIPYIQYLLAQKQGIYLNEIIISKSVLPTITSINKTQLEALTSNLVKIGDIDELAHRKRQYPQYLLEDIDVITNAINKIVSDYAGKKIAIVSDHGLTALSQFKDGMNLSGIKQHHGGRYAERTSGNTVSDSNYFILDDKKNICALNHKSLGSKISIGSSAHGGCTPEEVLVPIFIISPNKNQSNYSCRLLSKEVTMVSPIVKYEIKGLSSIDIPYVEYNDKQYRLNKETDDIYTSENIAFNGNVTDIVLHIGTYSYSGKIKISAAAEEDDLFNI